MKEFLTISEVVDKTDGIICESTLRYWEQTGTGPLRAGRLGRRLVYRRADVEAWLDAAFDGGAA